MVLCKSVVDEPEVRAVLASFPVLLPVPNEPDLLADKIREDLHEIAHESSSLAARERRFAELFRQYSTFFTPTNPGRRSLRIIATKGSYTEDLMPPKKRIQELIESITEVSGHHPYLWFLLSRKSDLEKAGVKAKEISKIANLEWQNLRRKDLLVFLAATVKYLTQHPNGDLNTYKQILNESKNG